MKKFIFAALACIASLAASAQYVPTTVGTVAKYTNKSTEAQTEVTTTETVTAVNTADSGVITVTFNSVTDVPGNDFAKISFEASATFDPATGVTVFTEMDAATFKKTMTDMIIQMAESQGHMVSETEMADLDRSLTPRGSLFLEINPEAAVGTVQKDCTLSMNMGQSRLLNKWGKITFAGTEEVTVPAGTFTCLKYTYTLTESMGEAPTKKFVTTYFAKGVGCVKEVSADKKGVVSAEKVLTSFTPAE